MDLILLQRVALGIIDNSAKYVYVFQLTVKLPTSLRCHRTF